MLYSFMKIHTLSLWVLIASDGHFIHTFLFICFPSNCLHSTPFLPPIFSGSFHLSFLFGNQSYCTRVVSFSSSTSKCLRFSSKGGGALVFLRVTLPHWALTCLPVFPRTNFSSFPGHMYFLAFLICLILQAQSIDTYIFFYSHPTTASIWLPSLHCHVC